MKLTNVARMLTASVAAAILSVALASCGGSGSGGSGAGSGSGNEAAAAPGSDAKTGKMFCSAIKEVQATILPDAESAAFLAQLALKLDPTVIYKLSAAAVDKSTKRECPTEYERFLKQAEITSLIDVGLQP